MRKDADAQLLNDLADVALGEHTDPGLLTLLIQDTLMVLLAWGYVGARYVHSLIHCSYNDVNHRFATYAVSCVFLLLLWIRLATYILMN